MKIITLNLNEPHSLTENIKLTITDIRGRQTSVGIDAPREIHIRRSELPALKQKRNNTSRFAA